ncbi:hypothetical protein Q8F55_008987 [Vanrija albida]|uniref:NADH dehydrogenase [ubiquinone] 1 alpha subcomplex subunit 1 n=1 Tax=Vanrija albida TaxID=181172 RepID=A0ABR3PSD3_9TREE
MPVPWEAVIPLALTTVMFGATGTLLNVVKRIENDGQPPRYGLDKWDDMMMARDERLTGSIRGQSTNPIAPEGFATNSAWDTEKVL